MKYFNTRSFLITLVILSVILLSSANLPSSNTIELDNEPIVYITATGKKYHKIDCRTITNSKTVKSIALSEAIEKGYEPCKVCMQ